MKRNDNRTFIIAEIGKGFIQTKKEKTVNECLKNAQNLVDAAVESGADAVKFQTHHYQDEQINIKVVSPHFIGEDRFSWVKRNTLCTPLDKFWRPLKEYCDKKRVIFFSTPMSRGAAQILEELGVPFWKISSADILDFALLDYVSKTKKQIVISSGMSTLEELDLSIDFLKKRKVDLKLLHCVSKYPCEPKDLHLETIGLLKKRYNIPVGFSDHSLSIESALVAVSLGSEIIEKHFSLNREFWGSDHKVSLIPEEFSKMVKNIRKFEKGSLKVNKSLIKKFVSAQESKDLVPEEMELRPYFRKSLVFGKNLKKGQVIKVEDVYAMRPQGFIKGYPSQDFERMIGRKTTRDVSKYDPVFMGNVDQSSKRICVVIGSRANYGRVKFLAKAINDHPNLDLQLVIGASAMLTRFGKTLEIIREDGFVPTKCVHFVVEGENLITQAKTTGLGIIELANIFEELHPDAVVTVADRYETMATAIASSYMNIPLVHIQGGEVTGNIDDRVRNAITKISDYHFPSTEESRKRIIKMGEDKNRVFNFGCPAIDVLTHTDLNITNEIMAKYGGTGMGTDWTKPFILVIQHPVTTEYGTGRIEVEKTLFALSRFKNIQKVVMWPNIDAGSDDVSKGIRMFKERNLGKMFSYYKNFSPEDYARVLNNALCCVGNSSSFIRENSFLGVPSVMIGSREFGREHGNNVVYVDYDTEDIFQAVKKQIKHGRFQINPIFGKGDAGVMIAQKLADLVFTLKSNNNNSINKK